MDEVVHIEEKIRKNREVNIQKKTNEKIFMTYIDYIG